jgi:hypothetical protein
MDDRRPRFVDGKDPLAGRCGQPYRRPSLTAVTADVPLMAAVEHGPGMHGGVVVTALFAIVVVGGLVYLAKGRRRSDSSADDRTREGRDG